MSITSKIVKTVGAGLVKKPVQVTRNGKTFTQQRMVRADGASKKQGGANGAKGARGTLITDFDKQLPKSAAKLREYEAKIKTARHTQKPDPGASHRVDVKPPKAPKGHPQAHTVTRDRSTGTETHHYSDGSKRHVRPGNPGHTEHRASVHARHVDALNAAGLDAAKAEAAHAAIKADKSLTSADIRAIARQYRGGGAMPKTKAEAHRMIAGRAHEKRYDAKKIEVAAKMRPL